MNHIFEVDLFSYAKDGVKKGCLMAIILGSLSNDIKDFQDNKIKPENLTSDGLEREHHVTVLYGFDPDFQTDPLKAFLENQESIKASLGSVSRFECPEYDVLKAEVVSPELQKLHYLIKDKFKDQIKTSYSVYHPHLTLGYVKHGSHKELDNHNALGGKQFSCGSLLYSPPDRNGRKNLKFKS